MGVRVIGPGIDISQNVVDVCLALTLMNIELYLANQFDCVSSATGSPIGDCISLKIPRLVKDHPSSEKKWEFLDVAGVPNFSEALLANPEEISRFLKLTRKSDAEAFRKWFHESKDRSEKDLLKAYIDFLHQKAWIQTPAGDH